MKTMTFADAISDALGSAMSQDSRIIVIGEDVQMIRHELFVRFGADRVRNTPISEGAFVGAAVAAAMAGLRPVVELMLIDFVGPAMDALLNHAAKIETFTGGRWQVPVVVRAPCGGGYGDGGQHEQALWGWLAHIPGLSCVVPSTPADAGGLLLAAVQHSSPVIFFEHKLLAQNWLDFMGSGGRKTVHFDVPSAGARGPVPNHWQPISIGSAAIRRTGTDLTIIGVGVSVHRALEAAQILEHESISAQIVDLRTVSPLDQQVVVDSVAQTGRLLVVDEDYQGFGLSGELAAIALEAGLEFRYARVCTETSIPYARHLEDQVLPNTARIVSAAKRLVTD